MEIHQQADAKLAHAQICHDLCRMGGEKGGNGLDFKKGRVRDRDIGAEAEEFRVVDLTTPWTSQEFSGDPCESLFDQVHKVR